MSSIAQCSSPLGVAPAAASVASSIRVTSLPIPFSPSASASRRAGSIVSTSTRPGEVVAASIATDAAMVVLPTPPGPQHKMISLVSVSRRIDGTGLT